MSYTAVEWEVTSEDGKEALGRIYREVGNDGPYVYRASLNGISLPDQYFKGLGEALSWIRASASIVLITP